jgi:NAD(P)-dependent dehydrogenase (short-subunit alcohol dehydrogenase family)
MALQSHVAVAKAGIDALSATTSIEYGPRGITSNIITPGPIMGTEVSSFLYELAVFISSSRDPRCCLKSRQGS